MNKLIVLLSLFLTSAIIHADTDPEELKKLDEECAKAREAFIAPLREAKIEQCIVEDGYEREKCARQLWQYGYAGHPRLGLDLPECIASHEAYKNQYK